MKIKITIALALLAVMGAASNAALAQELDAEQVFSVVKDFATPVNCSFYVGAESRKGESVPASYSTELIEVQKIVGFTDAHTLILAACKGKNAT